MSVLVVQLAPRSRLRAREPGSAQPESLRTSDEFSYVLSPDGLTVASHGKCAATMLPRADSVVLALDDTDVSWHRITLPKATQARLRAALVGVLEEALLEDADNVHLAVEPQAVGGQPAWVAAVNRTWLGHELQALEQANVFVDRVVPMSWPDSPPSGHFSQARSGEAGDLTLSWSHTAGVTPLRLQGGLARSLLPHPPSSETRWTATPAAAAAAEAQQWLGGPVVVVSNAERALQAARSLWNLRQFELARRSRGTRALSDTLRQFLSPAWRPVRYGLAALLLTQVSGLNLWAWQLRAAIDDKRAAQAALLQATYRHVGVALDAPLQMQRETAALRTIAGEPNPGDLEPLLQAAASAWPSEMAAVESLRYEPGHLTLAASGWGATQIEQFRSQLLPAGVQVQATDGSLVLSRAARVVGTGS